MSHWIWERLEWPVFQWDAAALGPFLARARLAQGKVLGTARLLDAKLSGEAVAGILVEEGFTTSAIEGEQLDVDAVRSSVARHLGLSTAGLPAPPRAVDGLVDKGCLSPTGKGGRSSGYEIPWDVDAGGTAE